MNIKEAIEYLNTLLNAMKWRKNGTLFEVFVGDTRECVKSVLAELEKKDKIINLMAEQLTTDIHSKEWVIDYYEREVEK